MGHPLGKEISSAIWPVTIKKWKYQRRTQKGKSLDIKTVLG
jgi:hypothetical protein